MNPLQTYGQITNFTEKKKGETDMLGGIIGDIIGSIYEFRNIKAKEFELFGANCDYTDDTILTIATAQWLLETDGQADSGRLNFRYGFNFTNPKGGYGTHFKQWVRR